jgi:uncharacterized membrane protein
VGVARISFVAVALLFGIAYAIVTPPFEVPDEVGHYWRASSIVYGYVTPGRTIMPRGFANIVLVLWTPDRTRHMTADRMRSARSLPLEPNTPVLVRTPPYYSPAAYVPQIAAAAGARVSRMRPFYGFYAGRLATLIVSIVMVLFASVIAPEFRDHFHVVALLPMSLFLFGSWSADAMTIVVAFLTSAFILRAFAGNVSIAGIVGSSLWLALCKPSYALLSFLALLIPTKRRVLVPLVLVVVIGGSLVSASLTISTAVARPRSEIPVDAHAQLQFIKDNPLRFARIIAHDFRANGFDYLKAMTGRFGLYELNPPIAVTALLLIMIAAIGLLNGAALPTHLRVAVVIIVAVIWLSILTYLYITSSIAGGTMIEGTQGRYILPVLPLMMAAIRIPALRFRVPYVAIIGIAAVANAIGIAALVHRYW